MKGEGEGFLAFVVRVGFHRVGLGWVGVRLGKGGKERVKTLKGCFAFASGVSPTVGLGFPQVLGPFGDFREQFRAGHKVQRVRG